MDGTAEAPVEDITYHIKGKHMITCFIEHESKKKRYITSDIFIRKITNPDNLAVPFVQEVPFDFEIKASSIIQAFKRRETTARKALEEFKRQSLNPGPPPDEESNGELIEDSEEKPKLVVVGG